MLKKKSPNYLISYLLLDIILNSNYYWLKRITTEKEVN